MMIGPVIEVSGFVLAVGGINLWVWLGSRESKQPTRQADPLRIAELEWEIFGIEPRPGSAAAFAVGMRQALGDYCANGGAGTISFDAGVSAWEIAEFSARYAEISAGHPRFTILGRGGVTVTPRSELPAG
jgi:hypothetical protein